MRVLPQDLTPGLARAGRLSPKSIPSSSPKKLA